MQIKNLTLGLGLLLTATALARNESYKVRNGDCDWTIARKFDTSVKKIHAANPQVQNWDALPNGFNLRIPISDLPQAKKHSGHDDAIVLAKTHTTFFKVSNDDNDWIIAHHFGISLHLLHQLNPNVDWNRLRPGKHIVVPFDDSETRVASAGTSHSSKIKVNRIHSRYAVINADAVAIRRDAGLHASRITAVNTGTRVVVLDRDGPWYKLRFPRGTEGWVRGDFLNAAKAPKVRHHRYDDDSYPVERVARRSSHHHHGTPEASVVLDSDAIAIPLIKTAVAMRGTRYSYGSSSRSATDCSGFTWQVYRTQGIHLPRTSSEQSHVGTPISTKQLKPGDLVFFSGTRGGRSVGHVGMYVGHNKFIHASSGGGKVQYNSLSDAYYASHFRGARRVLSQKKHIEKSHETKVAERKSTHKTTQAASVDTDPTPLGK